MAQVTIILAPEEKEALGKVAANELRTVREQARIIVRAELARRGLLPPPNGLQSKKAAQS